MKKILLSLAVVAFGVYTYLVFDNEMRVNRYVSGTASYVEGARINGAISDEDCENLKNSLYYSWFTYVDARKYRAERVRELVDAAYEVQREKQAQSEFVKAYRTDYVSYRMLSK